MDKLLTVQAVAMVTLVRIGHYLESMATSDQSSGWSSVASDHSSLFELDYSNPRDLSSTNSDLKSDAPSELAESAAVPLQDLVSLQRSTSVLSELIEPAIPLQDLVSTGVQQDVPTVVHSRKKPPAPRPAHKKRQQQSQNVGTDFRKTVRSPIELSCHLNQNKPLSEQTNSNLPSHGTTSPLGSGPHTTTPPRSSSEGKQASRFKQAVGTVQKLQSTAKKFQTSDEVREVVFKDWLAKKEVKTLQARQSLIQSERKEAEHRREKELALSRRSDKAVEKWTASKQAKISSAKKRAAVKAKSQAEEAKEKQQRCAEGREAAKQWRQEKKKKLIERHAEKMKELEEEERKKKEEKVVENKQAFQSWSQHKEKVMKEKARKTKEMARELEQTRQQQIIDKKTDADKAYDAWKAEKLKPGNEITTKKLSNEKPWRPARAMQYSYPKSKETTEAKPSKTNKGSKDVTIPSGSRASMESYSMSSFESAEASDLSEQSSLYSEQYSSDSEDVDSPAKGEPRLKTIQVCCQTLQYWCTCDLQEQADEFS